MSFLGGGFLWSFGVFKGYNINAQEDRRISKIPLGYNVAAMLQLSFLIRGSTILGQVICCRQIGLRSLLAGVRSIDTMTIPELHALTQETLPKEMDRKLLSCLREGSDTRPHYREEYGSTLLQPYLMEKKQVYISLNFGTESGRTKDACFHRSHLTGVSIIIYAYSFLWMALYEVMNTK